jgi:phosphotransacetylase
MGGAEALGPILMGMSMPVHVLARGSEVEEIVNMAAIAVVHAQVGVLGIQQSAPRAARPAVP